MSEIGKVRLIVGGDLLDVDWIDHDGKVWLVPQWNLSRDGRTMRPARIIGVVIAPGYNLRLGPETLPLFSKMTIPPSLFHHGDLSAEEASSFEVHENPEGIIFDTPE
jgi:hypothetical protein